MLYFELDAGFTARTWNADIFGATIDFCTSALFSGAGAKGVGFRS
jgi:hypothetical protein